MHRFLDKLSSKHQGKVEQIAFGYTKKRLRGKVVVVFYDLTTLYFETESEDDLRKVGFSKDGKWQNPQVMLGLLVAINGCPIGYDVLLAIPLKVTHSSQPSSAWRKNLI